MSAYQYKDHELKMFVYEQMMKTQRLYEYYKQLWERVKHWDT